LYSLTDYTFPDNPFMIALGTSHTAGDCDGRSYGPTSVKITAYDMVADELGLELVKIGLSGCKNEDLLQATNELAHHKALNDNCKLFMLEPRLGDRTVRLPVEAVIPDTFYVGTQDDDLDKYEKMPIMENNLFTAFGMLAGWGVNTNPNPPTIQQVAIDGRSNDKYGPINLATQAFIDASAFEAHSPLDIFNSVTIIDSIRHIVESNNVKFRWQLVNGRDNELPKLAKALLGEHSTLFDNFINIVEVTLEETNEDTIRCKCGHFNKQGHNLWYKNTIDYLR
jgi:hypothetical protein